MAENDCRPDRDDREQQQHQVSPRAAHLRSRCHARQWCQAGVHFSMAAPGVLSGALYRHLWALAYLACRSSPVSKKRLRYSADGSPLLRNSENTSSPSLGASATARWYAWARPTYCMSRFSAYSLASASALCTASSKDP